MFGSLHSLTTGPARTPDRVSRRLLAAGLSLLLLLLSSCASLPENYPKNPSTAFAEHDSTAIGKRLAEQAAEHPGESGFAIIRYGDVAFSARVAMTRMATKSLDLQYYIWEPDDTGRLLAKSLLDAADRGVRVRLLLDDMNTAGRDAMMASLSHHPNIEIRIANPFANRGNSAFDFITDFDRVNHRMHNKVMVMDNTFVIVGGRNIGDHYFSVHTETNFRDLDISAVGPVVRQVSDIFDYFWNGKWSVPVEALVDRPYTDRDLDNARATLAEHIATVDYPYTTESEINDIAEFMSSRDRTFIWAPGLMIWDDPASVRTTGEASEMVSLFMKKLGKLKEELTIESAYLVAGEKGVEAVQALTDRGVKVRFLTNSLASNDVVAAHAGHAEYRKQLLQAGAEIYEVRPDAAGADKSLNGTSRAGLHTKAIVFDRESVVVGSFNLDARSAKINTEASIYVESPELADQVLEYMDDGVKPENSYQVLLDDDGDLYWITQKDGVEIRYDNEPETTLGQRLMSKIIEMLPVQSQL